MGMYALGIPASLCRWLAGAARSAHLRTGFGVIIPDGCVNVFWRLFAPFCFCVFAVPTFLWDAQKWASEGPSAALAATPAIAVVVSRLCSGTRGWHCQCNKSKRAQLNRKQEISVSSHFLEELLKKESSSSAASEHFILYKRHTKNPVKLALFVKTTGIYLFCHRS